MANAPSVSLQNETIRHVLTPEERGDLERLIGELWQLDKAQPRDALVVVPEAVTFEDVLVAVPARDGRERRPIGGRTERPLIEEDRRPDVGPVDAAVRERRGRRADGLADREVLIVVRYVEEAAADPVLEQARVDVDERRAPEARQEFRVNLLVEIEQEVGALQRLLGLACCDSDVRRLKGLTRLALGCVQDGVVWDPES